MRKLAAYLTTALLVLSLAACATTPTGEKAKVKCPACGYEFTVGTSPGN